MIHTQRGFQAEIRRNLRRNYTSADFCEKLINILAFANLVYKNEH